MEPHKSVTLTSFGAEDFSLGAELAKRSPGERDWTDRKHEPDGTSPEHIDLEANHHLGNDGEHEGMEDEIDSEFYRMNITDATARAAALGLVRTRAARVRDKHREARARRAELRSLAEGKVTVGYFKTGFNKGADLLRRAMYALQWGV